VPTTDDLEGLLTAALGRHGLPGAVLAVRTPDGSSTVAAGVADTTTGEPMTAEHSFRLMSVVKPAVALAFARLVDAGRVAWDDTAATHVPELPATGAGTATVDHLLGMTAGLAAAGLADPPGTAWSYSNPAFGLLGRILEVVEGRDWLDVLGDLVLRPAGMTGATVREKLTKPAASEHLAGVPVDGLDLGAYGAAGTRLWVTIADVLALGEAILRDDARSLRVEQADVPVPYLADAWCRGLARFDWPDATAFGWDGIGVGVRNLLRVVPGRDVVVALSVNDSRGRLLWDDLVPAVVEAVGGGRVPALHLEPSGTHPDPARLLGSFERKGLPPAEIAIDGGELVARDLFGTRVLRHVRDDVYLSGPDDPDWPTVTLRPDAYYAAGFHFRRA
jgi:CubicO group peptidase (beta-lactamase class C family)